MLDRSTRAFWGVGFLVTALLVALWLIVRERPIGDWWLALLLLIITALLFLWGRGRASEEQPSAAPQEVPVARVREFEITAPRTETPALVTPVPAQEMRSLPDTSTQPAPATTIVEDAMSSAALAPASAPPEPVITTFAKVEDAEPTIVKPDNLLIIEGIGPKMDAALRAEGVDTYRKVADASIADLRAAIEKHDLTFAPSLVNWSKQARYLADGDQAGFEGYRDYLVRGLEPGQVVSRDYVVTQAAAETSPAPATPAAKPRAKKEAAPKPKKAAAPKAEAPKPIIPDDLKVVEGIGPKMEKALNAAGILTFAQLAAASEETIRAAIEAAGMRFAPSVPTWAKQADFATKGDMDGLKAYQAQLTAGRAT
jgi:predicted flap endonuclease-1-like 5' DNA nuclease